MIEGRRPQQRTDAFRSEHHRHDGLVIAQPHVSIADWIVHEPVIGQFEPALTFLLGSQLVQRLHGQNGIGGPNVYQGIQIHEILPRQVAYLDGQIECQ